jgi:hypothetical protein
VRPGARGERVLRPGIWYQVLERHPEPAGLANDGYALPGYVWLDLYGVPRHVWAASLEFRDGPASWTAPTEEETPPPKIP